MTEVQWAPVKGFEDSYAENNSHSTCYERAGETTRKQVYQYTKDWELVNTYWSAREACRQTGYTLAVVARACNNPETIRYGYHWSYYDLGDKTEETALSDVAYTNNTDIL